LLGLFEIANATIVEEEGFRALNARLQQHSIGFAAPYSPILFFFSLFLFFFFPSFLSGCSKVTQILD